MENELVKNESDRAKNFTGSFTVTSATVEEKDRVYSDVDRYGVLVVTCLSLYVLTVLVVYSWRTRRRNSPKWNHLSLLAAALTFIACLNRVLENWVPGLPCYAFQYWLSALYVVANGTVYTMIWARSRRLYSNKLLAQTVSKMSRTISALAILAICTIFFALVLIFEVVIVKYERPYSPCINSWKNSYAVYLILGIFGAASVLFQVLLFGLIVHPLTQGKSWKSKLRIIFSKSDQDTHKMLKRLAFCSAVCSFSTVLHAVVIALDNFLFGKFFINWGITACLDMLTNTTATVCAFLDWKERLFPMIAWTARQSTEEADISV